MTHYDYDVLDMHPGRRLAGAPADDDEFHDYVEATVDPGNTLFVVALLISLASLLGLPLFVRIGKCLTRPPRGRGVEKGEEEEEEKTEDLSCLQRCHRMSYSAVLFVLDHLVLWRRRDAHRGGNSSDAREEMVRRGMAEEAQQSVYIHQNEALADGDHAAGSVVEMTLDPSQLSGFQSSDDDKVQPAATSPGKEEGDRRLAAYDPENATRGRLGFLPRTLQFLWTVVRYDKETARILRLAVPFTVSAIVATVCELISLAVVGNYLGTDAMVAYAMVEVITGISSSLAGGWVDAISSLGSQAYGAAKYEVLGQYVQTSCIAYVLGEIPFAFIWGMTISDILRLMGFEEPVAVLAQDFVYIAVAIDIVGGIDGESARGEMGTAKLHPLECAAFHQNRTTPSFVHSSLTIHSFMPSSNWTLKCRRGRS